MKPMIILPPDFMDDENLKLLRENDICVVVAKDPAQVRFVDPIPAANSRTQIEHAAVELTRLLLNNNWRGDRLIGHPDFASLFTEIVIRGTALDERPSLEEEEQQAFRTAQIQEAQRLGREKAKAERAAREAAKAEKGAK